MNQQQINDLLSSIYTTAERSIELKEKMANVHLDAVDRIIANTAALALIKIGQNQLNQGQPAQSSQPTTQSAPPANGEATVNPTTATI